MESFLIRNFIQIMITVKGDELSTQIEYSVYVDTWTEK